MPHRHHEGHRQDQQIPGPLPIAERIGAHPHFTGKGVVAAFLDSGFYPHPDLVTPYSRIRAYYDLMSGRSGTEHLDADTQDPSAWHGMMSSVVAAGNGALSNGRFRSLAPQMDLVLVKVGTVQRIHHDDITRGIEWAILNRSRYGIRILNISCGGDYEESYLTDTLSRFAEMAVRAGIVVICAVGNRGDMPGHILPPASVPAVISVGGVDDAGNPRLGRISLYRSSYGPTLDGIQKPEIVTLADWLAAPILPNTPTHKQAALLSKLARAPDEELRGIIEASPGVFHPLDELRDRPPFQIRQVVSAALRDGLVIDKHYKMVDGTSFAAPIVTSVVAQMLEANPDLTPLQVKQILIKTARRLPDVEVDKQGWGTLQPLRAVEEALCWRGGHGP